MSIFKQTKGKISLDGLTKEVVAVTNELNLDQLYADAAATGATIERSLFEASLRKLPALAADDADMVMCPGVYKKGVVYGFNTATKTIEEMQFKRASTANFIDKDGVSRISVTERPRLEFDNLGQVKGYLLETAGTNLVPWSNDFSKWNQNATKATLSAKNTENGKQFTKIEKTDTASSRSLSTGTSIVSSKANTTYAFRVTLRADTSTTCSIGIGAAPDIDGSAWGSDANTGVRIISGPGSVSRAGALAAVVTLSATQDTVVEVTRKYVSDNIPLGVLVYPGGSGNLTLGASNLISCAQLEALPQCGTYVETTGAAATRASEILDLPIYEGSTVIINNETVINVTAGTLRISDYTDLLKSISVFSGFLSLSKIKQLVPSATKERLMFYSVKEAMSRLGAYFDEVAFAAQMETMHTTIVGDSEVILIPGAYKDGFVYGSDKNGILVPFSFTRNSVATYFDKNGIMQTATANMPRLDYDPLTHECKGYLQEPAGTNLIAWSNTFANYWGSSSVPGRVTPNVGLTSYGKPFSRVSRTSSTDTENISYPAVASAIVGQRYTVRITVKAETTNKLMMGLYLGNNWGANSDSSGRIISGEGTLLQATGGLFSLANLSTVNETIVEISRTVDAATSLTFIIYPNANAPAAAGLSVLVSCAQLEALPQCTSYIETTGAPVTREADSFQSVTDIAPYAEASIFMNMAPFTDDAKTGAVSIFLRKSFALTPTPAFWYKYTAGGYARFQPITNVINRDAYVSNGQNSRVLSSWSTSNFKMAANGSPVAVRQEAISAAINNGHPLVFQNDSTALIRNHIKAVAILARQLSDAEHQGITTENIFKYVRSAPFNKTVPEGYYTAAVTYLQYYQSMISAADAQAKANADAQFLISGQAYANRVGPIAQYINYTFKDNVIAAGGTFDDVFHSEYNSQKAIIKAEAETLLMAGAYKSGTIYGMNAKTGAIVPFAFSRDSTGTYFDKSGILQTAQPNVPRIDYDPVTRFCRGYLQEAAATNLLPLSIPTSGQHETQTIVNTNWGFPGKMVQGMQNTKAQGVTAPGVYMLATTLQNTYYTLSFFVKMSDNSVPVPSLTNSVPDTDFTIVAMGTFPNVAYDGSFTLQHIGNSIYRVSCTFDTKEAVGQQFGVRRYGTQTKESTFVVSGFQLEIGKKATSYIETTGAPMSRAAETLQSVNDVIPYAEASVYMEMQPLGKLAAGKNFTLFRKGSADLWYQNEANLFRVYDGVNTIINSNTNLENDQRTKVIVSFGSSLRSIANAGVVRTAAYKGGILGGSNTSAVISPDVNYAYSNAIRNYVKTLAVIPRQLTDAEHIALTA